MNNIVPILTTSVRAGHNPGDTLIGLGVQYLVERVLGVCNWQILCRFSSVRDWDKYRDLIDSAGFVIYGGMPQYNNYDDWKAWYDDELWREVIVPRGYQVVSIAGGGGYPRATWTPQQFSDHCCKSKLTKEMLLTRASVTKLFTVRDPHAHCLLNDLGIKNYHLPCSATFATHFCGITAPKHRPFCALVPPAPKGVPHNIRKLGPSEDLIDKWLDIYKVVKRKYNETKVVCHFYDEYRLLKDLIPDGDLVFFSDYHSLLKFYSMSHTVVSARLHGALPAYGVPGTKVVGISIDTRGHAVEIFPKIPSLLYENLDGDMVLDAINKATPSEDEDFKPFLETYDSLLTKTFKSMKIL